MRKNYTSNNIDIPINVDNLCDVTIQVINILDKTIEKSTKIS
jgi:hypothetical protein